MTTAYHTTAIVSPKAELADDVEVGPFTIIEDDVQVGAGTKIASSVVLANGARIGRNVRISPSVVIATEPQDLKFGGEVTHVSIGDNTVIREFATVNRGTKAHGTTTVGKNCLLMAYSHVAHDCILGDNVIIGQLGQPGRPHRNRRQRDNRRRRADPPVRQDRRPCHDRRRVPRPAGCLPVLPGRRLPAKSNRAQFGRAEAARVHPVRQSTVSSRRSNSCFTASSTQRRRSNGYMLKWISYPRCRSSWTSSNARLAG